MNRSKNETTGCAASSTRDERRISFFVRKPLKMEEKGRKQGSFKKIPGGAAIWHGGC
jgi:hypothetical protein